MASMIGTCSGRTACAIWSRIWSQSSPTHSFARTDRARLLSIARARSVSRSSLRLCRIGLLLHQEPFQFFDPFQEVADLETPAGVNQDAEGRPDLVSRSPARQVSLQGGNGLGRSLLEVPND